MDRPRCIWRPAREPTYCGGDIFYEPKLCPATLASISDLYWLQPHCLLAQRFRQFAASIRDEGGFRVVYLWFRHHFHHSLGMLISKLRQRQICFRYFHKWYAHFPPIPSLLFQNISLSTSFA